MSSQEDLRTIALAEFATAGYAGTSLQRIADLAGLSKSSVLYHYSSKEALLEAAIGPSIDRMGAILATFQSKGLRGPDRSAFLEDFVDFLLAHRLEVHMFINQGPSLEDVPVVERANALVDNLAAFFSANAASVEEKMRFGIALGGAAYTLCSVHDLEIEVGPAQEIRTALLTIMGELLSPIRIR